MPGTFTTDATTLAAFDTAPDGWTETFNAFETGGDFTDNRRQGTNLTEFDKSSTGYGYCRKQFTAFDMTSRLLHYWFYYTAKSEQVLGSADSVHLRVGSGASWSDLNYAEWLMSGHTTPGLYETLIASWNRFAASGDNPDNLVGTVNFSAIQWIELGFTWNSPNTQNGDPDLALDWLKTISKFIVTAGTSVSPADFISMDDWDRGGGTGAGTDPDYGVCRKTDVFVDMWVGFDIGDGVASTYFASEGEVIFMNHFSEDCALPVVVKNNATFRLGELDTTGTEDYAINGSTLVIRETPRDGQAVVPISDFTVDSGGDFLCYASKVFRWNDVDINGTATFIDADIDSCISLNLANAGITLKNTKVHDFRGNGYAGDISAAITIDGLQVFNLVRGFNFTTDVTVANYKASDCSQYDLTMNNLVTVTLDDPDIDFTKVAQI